MSYSHDRILFDCGEEQSIYTTPWISFGGIMLNEWSQSQNATHCIFLLILKDHDRKLYLIKFIIQEFYK